MRYLSVRNLSKFQHYSDRCPPWIKLHRSLFTNYEFTQLSDSDKAHLMLIWILASQTENHFPEDGKWLQGRLGVKTIPNTKRLVDAGFLIASEGLAEGEQNGGTEKRQRREETEKNALALRQINEVLGTKWRSPHRSLKARLGEGYSGDECALVAKTKRDQWAGTDMAKYIRQSTLFSSSKFEGYLDEARGTHRNGVANGSGFPTPEEKQAELDEQLRNWK